MTRSKHKVAQAQPWCKKCGVDVYLDGRCCAFGCHHVKGAPIANTADCNPEKATADRGGRNVTIL